MNGCVTELDAGLVNELWEGVTAFLALATVLARSARVARRVVAADKADWSWERWDGGCSLVRQQQ